MTELATLIGRIDQELETEVKGQKVAWAEVARVNRERGPRFQGYEAVAKRIIELLRPRLGAFIERVKSVVKTEPRERQHTRALNLTLVGRGP